MDQAAALGLKLGRDGKWPNWSWRGTDKYRGVERDLTRQGYTATAWNEKAKCAERLDGLFSSSDEAALAIAIAEQEFARVPKAPAKGLAFVRERAAHIAPPAPSSLPARWIYISQRRPELPLLKRGRERVA